MGDPIRKRIEKLLESKRDALWLSALLARIETLEREVERLKRGTP